LEEIIEIRGYRLNIEERIIDTNKLKEIIDVKVTLLTELDLKVICNKNNLDYNKLMREWINSPDTSVNDNSGKRNLMYGKHHSDKTKSIISEKAKERMEDEEYKNNIVKKMIQYCIDTNYADAKKPRSKRTTLKCKNCGEEFTVTEAKDYRQYCSVECANTSKANIENLKRMSETMIRNKENKYNNIKQYIEIWAKENNDIIKEMKLNKITPLLKILINNINNKFGVKDMRVITDAVCKSKSRKEFAKYLKSIILNHPHTHY